MRCERQEQGYSCFRFHRRPPPWPGRGLTAGRIASTCCSRSEHDGRGDRGRLEGLTLSSLEKECALSHRVVSTEVEQGESYGNQNAQCRACHICRRRQHGRKGCLPFGISLWLCGNVHDHVYLTVERSRVSSTTI